MKTLQQKHACGVRQGKSHQAGVQAIKDNFGPAFSAGSVYWPLVNIVNFAACPPEKRILLASSAALVYNTFLRCSAHLLSHHMTAESAVDESPQACKMLVKLCCSDVTTLPVHCQQSAGFLLVHLQDPAPVILKLHGHVYPMTQLVERWQPCFVIRLSFNITMMHSDSLEEGRL